MENLITDVEPFVFITGAYRDTVWKINQGGRPMTKRMVLHCP